MIQFIILSIIIIQFIILSIIIIIIIIHYMQSIHSHHPPALIIINTYRPNYIGLPCVTNFLLNIIKLRELNFFGFVSLKHLNFWKIVVKIV